MKLFKFTFLVASVAVLLSTSNESWALNSKWNTLEFVNQRFSNLTSKSYNGFHGTQIEYTSSNGRAYLIYPGNTHIVSGRWKARLTGNKSHDYVELCFKYGANTYNPSTGKLGGNWGCKSAAGPLRRNKEMYRGDILGLSGMLKLPAILPKRKNLYVTKVMKLFGIKGQRGRNLAR